MPKTAAGGDSICASKANAKKTLARNPATLRPATTSVNLSAHVRDFNAFRYVIPRPRSLSEIAKSVKETFMSHWRARTGELRAIFAIAAICALLFGLLVSGAHLRLGSDTLARQAASAADAHVVCHHQAIDQSQDEKSNGGDEAKRGCPCCLAAHAGPVVLPERAAASTRIERTALRALYVASAEPAPRSIEPHAVNGARAPPLARSIS
jgi:hypothetical protein